MRGGKPRPTHAGVTRKFSRDLDDHYFDGFAALAKETTIHRVRVGSRIDLGCREIRVAFQGPSVEPRSGHGGRHVFKGTELIGLYRRQSHPRSGVVALHRHVLSESRKLCDELSYPGIVLRWNALCRQRRSAADKE